MRLMSASSRIVDQVPQTDVVVAASVHSHIDHEFVRSLLLDEIEESVRVLAQVLVSAKTVIHGLGSWQVGVPEILIGLLSKKGASLL